MPSTDSAPVSSMRAIRHARLICDAFRAFEARFHVITRRARRRFEQRDWHAVRADASERLSLYRQVVDQVETDIRERLKADLHDKTLWNQIRTAYSGFVADRPDAELAETFFNSVTRRVFDTVGVDPKIEFVTTDIDGPQRPPEEPITCTFDHDPAHGASNGDALNGTPNGTVALMGQVLRHYRFSVPYADLDGDAERAAHFINERLVQRGLPPNVSRIELACSVFYRGIGAYLVGRLYAGDTMVPLALALHNSESGVCLDAVMLREDDISILFSFARSYFHVVAQHPHALVHFLKQILPRKRVAELYIAIGYNKHGKTELYRDLLQHFAHTTDQFVRAIGQRGMVMTVFTMASYDMVFKLIKDRFDYPKSTTRQNVKDRYHLVFKHDRAGRLVDAQEFEHLRLSRRLFSEELLEELLEIAGNTVEVRDDRVVIAHTYVERRVIPLDVYVRSNDEDKAIAALVDYGNAIKDLARTNIFPGDLLLKNFGVTRHGRVVFYDYDELCFVTDCNFRTKPEPRTHADEMATGAWFYVGPDDVFPEEFKSTMGVSGRLMEAFLEEHGDIFEASFWQETQQRIEAGEIIPILPYPARERLPHRRTVHADDIT